MKQLIQKAFGVFGLHLSRANSQYGVWQQHPEFIDLYNSIKSNSVVKIDRIFSLYQYAHHVKKLDGDVAELGVYRGGTAKLFLDIFKNTGKTVYLFDTFEGMPKEKAKEEYRNDSTFVDTSLEVIQEYVKDYTNVEFKKGVFPDTTVGLEDKKFSLVYLDADLYESTKDGLDFFYPRMVPGGVIIVDDYKSHYWPGVEKSIIEFTKRTGVIPIVSTWQQCILIKPCT